MNNKVEVQQFIRELDCPYTGRITWLSRELVASGSLVYWFDESNHSDMLSEFEYCLRARNLFRMRALRSAGLLK